MISVETLFERHHLGVFRYLRRMTGNSSQAEELAQDVFVRVIRSRPGSRPETSESGEAAWLFAIARNALLNWRRDGSRRPAEAPLDSDGPAGPVSIAPSQPGALAMQDALDRLDPDRREAFVLREVAGLGYAEIAEACGTTPDAIRNRIHRARLELREMLVERKSR